MKSIFLLILFFIVRFPSATAQSLVLTTRYESDIIGTWIARSGSKSYELTFVTTYKHLPPLGNIKIAVGRMIYMDGADTVRITTLNSRSPFIFGVYLKRYHLNLSIIDEERDVTLTVDFNISKNLKTASWCHLKDGDRLVVRNSTITWRKGTTDLPEHLTFTRTIRPATELSGILSENSDLN